MGKFYVPDFGFFIRNHTECPKGLSNSVLWRFSARYPTRKNEKQCRNDPQQPSKLLETVLNVEELMKKGRDFSDRKHAASYWCF